MFQISNCSTNCSIFCKLSDELGSQARHSSSSGGGPSAHRPAAITSTPHVRGFADDAALHRYGSQLRRRAIFVIIRQHADVAQPAASKDSVVVAAHAHACCYECSRRLFRRRHGRLKVASHAQQALYRLLPEAKLPLQLCVKLRRRRRPRSCIAARWRRSSAAAERSCSVARLPAADCNVVESCGPVQFWIAAA